MRARFPASVVLPLLLLLGAAAGSSCTPGTDPNDAGPNGPDVVWETAFDPSLVGSISGVWGSGPSDVFAVGGEDTGVVVHYDGNEWTTMDVPTVGLLVWVYGFGPDDVFAVGVDGGAIHYDGSTWTALDSGTEQDLWGVFGHASNDVWVVGGDTDEGDPIILHWDGSAFTPVTIDAAENPNGARSLFKVWGIGSKVFAVGQRGLILEYSGGSWLRRPAGAEADDDFVSLWGTSEDHIVAVGGRANARIATWDGSAWDTIAPSGIGGLSAVFMAEAGSALVGGVEGTVASFDVSTQELAFEDPDTRLDIHAIWGDGAGKHYAVGGTFLPGNHRGVALVRSVAD
jgi:hypothetical protein